MVVVVLGQALGENIGIDTEHTHTQREKERNLMDCEIYWVVRSKMGYPRSKQRQDRTGQDRMG